MICTTYYSRCHSAVVSHAASCSLRIRCAGLPAKNSHSLASQMMLDRSQFNGRPMNSYFNYLFLYFNANPRYNKSEAIGIASWSCRSYINSSGRLVLYGVLHLERLMLRLFPALFDVYLYKYLSHLCWCIRRGCCMRKMLPCNPIKSTEYEYATNGQQGDPPRSINSNPRIPACGPAQIK